MDYLIEVKKLRDDAILPSKANNSDAGYDLYSTDDTYIPGRQRAIISTGIAISMKSDTPYYYRVAPRSGMAAKNGIDVFAGVVDSEYRGEVKVILYNSGDAGYDVKKGDRIAQLIPTPILITDIQWTENLEESQRGADGFGSTGR